MAKPIQYCKVKNNNNNNKEKNMTTKKKLQVWRVDKTRHHISGQ